jgi:hypothetical protein
MDQPTSQQTSLTQEPQAATPSPEADKQPWQEPKLAFVEPTLTPHGKLEHMTAGGFFGTFIP